MSNGDHEHRLQALEQEVRRWRWAAVGLALTVALLAGASCDEPATRPTSFELASDDGTVRMHLDARGLRFDGSGGGSAQLDIAGLHVEGADGATNVAPARIIISAPQDGDRMNTLSAGSVLLSGGPGAVRVENAELARVTVSAEASSAELSAHSGSAGFSVTDSNGRRTGVTE